MRPMRASRRMPTVERMRWRRFLHLALSLSAAAFVVGLIVEGFWGVDDVETNWVDQSFGFVMYFAGALTVLLALLLAASVLVAGAYRLLWNRGPASTRNAEP